LSFFTGNEKLDELALLHTPVEKLKQIFGNNKLFNIALPINFLAYKAIELCGISKLFFNF
jgi:hypothetical protein